MFCNKCGKELSENAKFCWSCGASIAPAPTAEEVIAPEAPVEEISTPPVSEAPVYEAPVYEAPVWATPVENVAQPKKKRKKWIPFAILGSAVAAIAAILLTMFFTGFFDTPEMKLYKAFSKSANAFAEADAALGLPDFRYIQDENAYSAEFGFVLNNVQGNDALRGLGLRASMDYNLPAKKLGLNLTPSYGAVDLLDLQLKLDNDQLYIGSPQITGNTFYSANTETMLMDLSELGMDVGGGENIRINVFELLQILTEETMFSKEDEQKLTDAAIKLLKTIEADSLGSEQITVNGHDLKCDKYHVVLSKEALLEYYEVVLELMATTDMSGLIDKLCQSLNITPEELGLTVTTPDTDEVMESLEKTLDEYGDIELTVYLKGGYVMAVAFDISFEDEALKCMISIGGSDNYVDDLSLSLESGGQTILLESSGNHTGKNGSFTDNTKLSMKGQGFSMTILNSSLSFDSRKSGENFQWTIKTTSLASIAFYVTGNVSYDSTSMTVDQSDIVITQYDEELVALSLYYKLDKYTDNIQVGDTMALLELSEDAFQQEMTSLGNKINQWAMGIADQIPELLGMIV